MKKIIIIFTIALSSTFFVACDNESTDEVSEITFFPEVELLGDPIMIVEHNTTFDDPEINATIQGSPVPYQVVGSVDTSTPGIYNLNYTVTNDDGFSAGASRIVFVYENNGTVAGFWRGSTPQSSDNPVLISSTSDPNVFNISDILGGNYEFGRGYGIAYRTPSTITISGTAVTSPGGTNAFGAWEVANGSISVDQRTMTWDSPAPSLGFTLAGITLEKETP